MFNWLFLLIAFYPKDKAAIKMTNTQNRKDVDNINIATFLMFICSDESYTYNGICKQFFIMHALHFACTHHCSCKTLHLSKSNIFDHCSSVGSLRVILNQIPLLTWYITSKINGYPTDNRLYNLHQFWCTLVSI